MVFSKAVLVLALGAVSAQARVGARGASESCVMNMDCESNPWCGQGDVYESWCPAHSVACPWPQCVRPGETTTKPTAPPTDEPTERPTEGPTEGPTDKPTPTDRPDNNVPVFQRGGYLENWKAAGAVPGPFNVVYYAFLTLVQRPNADNPPQAQWDGSAIYESMTLADVQEVMEVTDPAWENPHNWQRVKIQDAIDKCKAAGSLFMWAIGGWSDITKTISDAQIPLFVEKVVQLLRLGGDGVDFDWEHVSQYKHSDEALFRQQRAIIGKTISALRKGMDAAGMHDKHISYTTRWNCFWTSADAHNHAQAKTFDSDGECLDTFQNMESMDQLSWINLMMYDAGPYSAFEGVQYFGPKQYQAVLDASAAAGVPKHKIVMGFEPGFQAVKGVWEGFDIDFAVINKMKSEGYGGAMWWAMNEDKATKNPATPTSSVHQWQGTTGANAHYIAKGVQ